MPLAPKPYHPARRSAMLSSSATTSMAAQSRSNGGDRTTAKPPASSLTSSVTASRGSTAVTEENIRSKHRRAKRVRGQKTRRLRTSQGASVARKLFPTKTKKQQQSVLSGSSNDGEDDSMMDYVSTAPSPPLLASSSSPSSEERKQKKRPRLAGSAEEDKKPFQRPANWSLPEPTRLVSKLPQPPVLQKEEESGSWSSSSSSSSVEDGAGKAVKQKKSAIEIVSPSRFDVSTVPTITLRDGLDNVYTRDMWANSNGCKFSKDLPRMDWAFYTILSVGPRNLHSILVQHFATPCMRIAFYYNVVRDEQLKSSRLLYVYFGLLRFPEKVTWDHVNSTLSTINSDCVSPVGIQKVYYAFNSEFCLNRLLIRATTDASKTSLTNLVGRGFRNTFSEPIAGLPSIDWLPSWIKHLVQTSFKSLTLIESSISTPRVAVMRENDPALKIVLALVPSIVVTAEVQRMYRLYTTKYAQPPRAVVYSPMDMGSDFVCRALDLLLSGQFSHEGQTQLINPPVIIICVKRHIEFASMMTRVRSHFPNERIEAIED